MQPELPVGIHPDQLENYLLLFKSRDGDLLGFSITSYLANEEIDSQIETATREWMETEEGKIFIEKENLKQWGLDYANALTYVPPEILAQHGIFLGERIQEIIELDAHENLLLDEMKTV